MNSLEYLISSHQTQLRTATPDEKIYIAILDNPGLRKDFVEIDRQKNPRVSVLVNYEENDYIQQYKDLKLLFKEYIREPI